MTILRARALPSFGAGLRAAAARPGLLVAIWASHLLLAAAASLPLFRALGAATAHAPATDRLLERFTVSLFGELLHYTALPVGQMVQMAAVGALLVAVVAAPALLAAVVTALEAPARPAAGELAAAAGRWYWPFLRLFVFGRLVGLLVAGLAAGAAGWALRPVRESLWEAGRLASGPMVVALALVPVALLFAATDYAMIHAVRTGSRRMFAAWRMGLRASLFRPVTTLGLWMLAALLVAALAALLLAVLGTLGGSSRVAIAVAFVVQQLFMLFRIGVRVGLLGAEGAAWRVQPDPLPEPALPVVADLDPGTA